MSNVVAIAKYHFVGQSETELSFRAGARIVVTSEREPGEWWKGEIGGKRGFFPSSFCDVHRELPADEAHASLTLGVFASADGDHEGENILDRRGLASEESARICIQGVSSPKVGHKRYVRAVYDFTASRRTEMDLRRGAVYRVISEQGHWLVGENDTGTQSGEFPGTYVEPYAPVMAAQAVRGLVTAGGRAVYRLCAFAGMTCAHITRTPRSLITDAAAQAAGLGLVREAAGLLRVALVRLKPQVKVLAALGMMLHGFQEACKRVARFVGTDDPAGVHDLSCFCCSRISRATPDEVVLLPLGWLGTTSPQATIVILALRRRRDDPSIFDLAIVNAGGAGGAGGDGRAIARYHGLQIDSASADLWSRSALILSNVTQEKLQDGGLWFVLYRLLIFPRAAHNADTFYDRILPTLNGVKPVQANDSTAAAWTRGLGAGDLSGGAVVVAAVRQAAILCGEAGGTADGYMALARLELLSMARDDLEQARSLSAHDAAIMDNACRSVARDCALCAEQSSSPVDALALQCCLEYTRALDARRMALCADLKVKVSECTAAASALFSGARKSIRAPGGACFPLFGRFRRGTNVDDLAGAALVPPITLPVEISVVPDAVDSYVATAILLRRSCEICSLLANQAHLLRHTYLLRLSLLMHVIARVLPFPRPCYDAASGVRLSFKRCFWRRSPLRRETQTDLLDLLRRTSRHLGCVSLSLKVTRALDAARILASGCIAVVADAVLRRSATDVPSWLSLHYSGDVQGPAMPFGFDLGVYDVESRHSAFVDPYLCAMRTNVLDYFAGLRAAITAGRFIFAFERADVLGPGERALLHQLCLQTSTPLLDQPEVYLTGERQDLVHIYPELACFRDVVFLFKVLQVPTSDALPDLQAWRPEDCSLAWQSKARPPKQKKNRDSNYRVPPRPLVCKAFGRILRVTAKRGDKLMAEDARQERSTWSHVLDFVGLGTLPRVPPSRGDPSTLLGTRVETEEDVLHCRHLPEFGGHLNSRDAELMLSYLTAPYIRMPLLLRFFADHTRLRALASPELQEVLDACLFEPGLWNSPSSHDSPGTAMMVPAPDRRSLATPCGLLFNELRCAPAGLVGTLDAILENVPFFLPTVSQGEICDLTSWLRHLSLTRVAMRRRHRRSCSTRFVQ
mmetsp:Transcript_25879/g.77963  ORF Transcript_25879/g.77963 Transcript_25879/m.77963 type:complete len:1143 (+) Transcript_25879:198-3626(+)